MKLPRRASRQRETCQGTAPTSWYVLKISSCSRSSLLFSVRKHRAIDQPIAWVHTGLRRPNPLHVAARAIALKSLQELGPGRPYENERGARASAARAGVKGLGHSGEHRAERAVRTSRSLLMVRLFLGGPARLARLHCAWIDLESGQVYNRAHYRGFSTAVTSPAKSASSFARHRARRRCIRSKRIVSVSIASTQTKTSVSGTPSTA